MRKWLQDRGGMNLEMALLVAFLVLTASVTLSMLGDEVACLIADEAVTSAAVGPDGVVRAAELDYPGRCVPIRRLEATDNGDGTASLAWIGGEAPFTVYRSDTELVAFDASDSPFLDVAYAAGGAVVQDLDGDNTNRTATVEAGDNQTWYQVTEVGGGVVVASLMHPASPVVRMVAGIYQSYGIRKDGSVLTAGSDMYGQVSIPRTWSSVRDIAGGSSYWTAACLDDGTVVTVGDLPSGYDLDSWTDVVAIETANDQVVGLRGDGTVYGRGTASTMAVSNWTDIIEVALAPSGAHGLRTDGTVVSSGGSYGSGETSEWTGIVQLAVSRFDTYGLRSDGTVAYTGRNRHGERDAVTGWTDIVDIAAGGLSWVAGLRSDGTVVAAGLDDAGQVTAASVLTDMATIDSCGGAHLVGMKIDGTVIAVGLNNYGQCDVGSWNE